METESALIGGVVGVVSSLVAQVIIVGTALFVRQIRHPLQALRLALRLTHSGVTGFYAHRNDYRHRPEGGGIVNYLLSAKHTIDIVAIDLAYGRTTENVPEAIRRFVAADGERHVRVSLLAPDSVSVPAAALALGVAADELRERIRASLIAHQALRNQMTTEEQQRFEVLVHDEFPMASAILLDVRDDSLGRIQIESKLCGAPSSESFGFELRAGYGDPSFYKRNRQSWLGVLQGSRRA